MNGTSYCDMHGDRLLYMPVFTAVSIHIKKHVLAQNIQAPLFLPKHVINSCKTDSVKNSCVYNNLSPYSQKPCFSTHNIVVKFTSHSTNVYKLTTGYITSIINMAIMGKDRQCMYNITLRHVHVTFVAVEKHITYSECVLAA